MAIAQNIQNFLLKKYYFNTNIVNLFNINTLNITTHSLYCFFIDIINPLTPGGNKEALKG